MVVFFGVWVFWNMLFSPLVSTVPTLMLAVGFILAEFPVRKRAPLDCRPNTAPGKA